MIAIKIKTSSGNHRLLFPTKWHELTAKQLIGITALLAEERQDLLKVFELLTGQDLETIGSIKDAKVEHQLWGAISFLNQDPPDWSKLEPPKKLVIGDEYYDYPHRLGTETLGQKIRLSQLVQNSEDLVECFPEAVAIYLQPYFDKQKGKARKFDADRIPYALDKINDANGLDIYALGLFFLNVLGPSLRIGVKGLITKTIQRRADSRMRQISSASTPSGS